MEKGRGEGREGEGEGGIAFAGPWIVCDRVTVTVVFTLSMVLLWRQRSASMVQHEARPVPTLC